MHGKANLASHLFIEIANLSILEYQTSYQISYILAGW